MQTIETGILKNARNVDELAGYPPPQEVVFFKNGNPLPHLLLQDFNLPSANFREPHGAEG